MLSTLLEVQTSIGETPPAVEPVAGEPAKPELTIQNRDIYSKLLEKGLIAELGEDELVEGADALELAVSKLKSASDLPKEVRIYKEAMEKAGGDLDAYRKVTAAIDSLTNLDVAKYSAEQKPDLLKTLYKLAETDDFDEATTDAKILGIVDKGLIDKEITALAAKVLKTKEAEKASLSDSWETAKKTAAAKFSETNKPVELALQETKTLLGLPVDDKLREKLLAIMQPEVRKGSTKSNIAPTSEFLEVVTNPENQIKIALLIANGIFKKQSKFSLAANQGGTEKGKQTEDPNALDMNAITNFLKFA